MISVVYSGSIHLLAGDREREQIVRDDLVVVDHPLAGDEVPEDVRITASAHDHAEDHHECGDHQQLSGRDATYAMTEGCGHHVAGYSVACPVRPPASPVSQIRASRCFR